MVKVIVFMQMKEKERRRGILLFEYFGEKQGKLWETRDLKKNAQKENENGNDHSDDTAGLALVRGLDGCFGCGGEDNKC